MAIIRAVKKSNFTVVDNGFTHDKNLSFKAKGLMLYLLTKPDDWQVYTNEIIKNSKDGKASVSKALKELEEAGYIEREYKRGKGGLYTGGYDYTVYEIPIKEREEPKADLRKSDKGKAEKPISEKRKTEERNSDNQPLLNTQYKLNTKYKPITEIKENTKDKLSTKPPPTPEYKEDKNNGGGDIDNNYDIYTFFTKGGFGPVNDVVKEIIDNHIKEHSKDVFKEALLDGIKNNKYKLSYVEGILKRYKKENKGVDTNGNSGTSYEEELRRAGLIFDLEELP